MNKIVNPFGRSKMYDKIGGIQFIDKLVDDFYEIMSSDPLAADCFATHSGRDIRESAEKLKYFLSGWTGGPQLYLEKIGHPKLRMRHFPFKIGAKEADQWLYCMRKALTKSSLGPELQEQLMSAFKTVTDMLSLQK
jgi:hemoglobin